MINIHKLNRIKGILSAKQGTKIPKFLNPATPINLSYYIKDGKYYLDNKEVSKDVFFSDPRVSNIWENYFNANIPESIDSQKTKTSLNTKLSKLINNTFQSVGQTLNNELMYNNSNTTNVANKIYDVGVDSLEKFGGKYGKIISTGLKNAAITGSILQKLGGGTDQMTNTDKWMDSSFANWNVGAINGFFGQRSNPFSVDTNIASSVGSSYTGSYDTLYNVLDNSNKKYGLFSSNDRERANKQSKWANLTQKGLQNISDNALDLRLHVLSMGELAGLAYSVMTDGGYNLKYTYAAKHGGVLEWNPEITLEWEPQVELNWELPAFKEGGKIEESNIPEIEETTQKNVIPEGALHKNKHHMEYAEGLTKKGIPVIDEGGELQAEIELNEIIFTLEVTKKLEEYYEIFYSEDSTNKEKELAALEAGKLLVYEILENTDDRTGLIESCKLGGSLTLKKSTDDLIEEALEWIPNIIVVEETIKETVEDKPKKENKEKELMKEAVKEVLIELLTK